jgi:hypothetical protein
MDPAVEPDLGTGSNGRLVVAAAIVEGGDQTLTRRGNLARRIAKVIIRRIFRQNRCSGSRRQALAGEVVGRGPVVLVVLRRDEGLVFLGQGLGEGRARTLRLADFLDIADAAGQQTEGRNGAENL